MSDAAVDPLPQPAPTHAKATPAEIAFVGKLAERAASPYQRSSGFAWRFARAKCTRDPLFRTLLATGAIPDASCLVDLGCGQGLLAAWLKAAYDASQSTELRPLWPAHWPLPPKVGTYLGVDRSRHDIARAKPAMAPFARVFRGDVRKVGMAMLDRCDVVTLLDVLHYLDTATQDRLLTAIATALPPWGVLVLRIGDGTTLASGWTNAIDLAVCALRGQPRLRVHRRSLAGWRELLERLGFRIEVLHDERDADAPHRFANVLLRARRALPPTSDSVADAAKTDEPVR
jgi:SAM-dependent methyltransferase